MFGCVARRTVSPPKQRRAQHPGEECGGVWRVVGLGKRRCRQACPSRKCLIFSPTAINNPPTELSALHGACDCTPLLLNHTDRLAGHILSGRSPCTFGDCPACRQPAKVRCLLCLPTITPPFPYCPICTEQEPTLHRTERQWACCETCTNKCIFS